MKTIDKYSFNVSIVQTVDQGIVNDPDIYISELHAQKAFEELITIEAVGFRHRFDLESFDSYKESFHEWEDTKECPYDKMDWEIHIWL